MTQGMGVWFSENTLPPHSVVHTDHMVEYIWVTLSTKVSSSQPRRRSRSAPRPDSGRRRLRAAACPCARPSRLRAVFGPFPCPAGRNGQSHVVLCHLWYGGMVSLLRDPRHERYGGTGMVFSWASRSQVGRYLAAERNPAKMCIPSSFRWLWAKVVPESSWKYRKTYIHVLYVRMHNIFIYYMHRLA